MRRSVDHLFRHLQLHLVKFLNDCQNSRKKMKKTQTNLFSFYKNVHSIGVLKNNEWHFTIYWWKFRPWDLSSTGNDPPNYKTGLLWQAAQLGKRVRFVQSTRGWLGGGFETHYTTAVKLFPTHRRWFIVHLLAYVYHRLLHRFHTS